jgi:hypothetical protein
MIGMENIGRYLILAGVLLVLLGGALCVAARVGLPIGRLPGDIRMTWRGGAFNFPIATSILVSVVLTVVLNLLARFLQK